MSEKIIAYKAIASIPPAALYWLTVMRWEPFSVSISSTAGAVWALNA